MNLYTYARNNVINIIDELGLRPCCEVRRELAEAERELESLRQATADLHNAIAAIEGGVSSQISLGIFGLGVALGGLGGLALEGAGVLIQLGGHLVGHGYGHALGHAAADVNQWANEADLRRLLNELIQEANIQEWRVAYLRDELANCTPP